MTTPDPDPVILAWTRLIRSGTRIFNAIEAALKARGLPSLAWYDALLEAERADAEGLRPFELQSRLLLPQYGTSRLLDRLHKAGLITRETAKSDGRGQVIRITPKGRVLRRDMWPVYRDTLKIQLQDHLTDQQLEQLAALLQPLGASDP